jgi:mycothione reductase
MKEYDVIVIGSGAGLNITYKALSEDMKVALVAREYLGGTCMNVGCVPSKTLLYTADKVIQIEEARKLGVKAEISSIDFPSILKRVRNARKDSTESIRRDLQESKNLDFYEREGQFIDDYTMMVGDEKIRGENIFIASGARPAIPPIKGLSDIRYLTNESVLLLEKLPESIIIIGGSYIGVEYAHFFSAMGSDVCIVEYNDRMVSFEEPEVSELLERSLEKRMKIYPGHEALAVEKDSSGFVLTIQDHKTKTDKSLKGQEVLVATGRISNADRLKTEKTGVTLTPKGFIYVDDYLQTSKPHIMALGDATGKGMFTHAADQEVDIAWHNAFHEDKIKMNFDAVPHAVFTSPQIASIGLTEAEAAKRHDILVGKAQYDDTVQGDVRMVHEGFAKAIVEKKTGQVLGFHIVGPDAAMLIQEVVNVVARKGDYRSITRAMHIFPSLSDLIPETFERLKK